MPTPMQKHAKEDRAPLAHGMLHTLTGIQILATGSYVPERVVDNNALQEMMGVSSDWITQRTGIHERRYVADNQATSDLGVAAARKCLQSSGVRPEDVDLLILATFTPDKPVPSTACLMQKQLGIHSPAMDLHAGCAGFLYALVTAAQFVHSRCCKRVLVVGADCSSRMANPDDQKTYPLFGDGAGAILLAPGSSSQGLLSYSLGADGDGAPLIEIPGGGSRARSSSFSHAPGSQFIQMDGRAVFKWAVRLLCDNIQQVLTAAGLSADDVDLFCLHQANLRILESAAADLGISRDKLLVNIDRFGNTSAASIPLVLDEAMLQGKIHPGSCVVMSGFGAGLAWGTALLRW